MQKALCCDQKEVADIGSNCLRISPWVGSLKAMVRGRSLDSASSPAEQQNYDHDQQDEAKAAPTVVTDSRTHVIAPTADQEQKNDENDDQWHAWKSSTNIGASLSGFANRVWLCRPNRL